MNLLNSGAYLLNKTEIIPDASEALQALKHVSGIATTKEEAQKATIAYGILAAHNTSDSDQKLRIKFDKLTSHDITFVGIIQTARASGLTKFPLPYVLTNCHNSLCAVGGTINEDDHMFGLTCAKKYGGVYVPPHQAVIHQYAREMMAGGGKMILGSDSHTRYGALGTMAMGEGGPELVKQLLNQTYDINMPEVVLLYLTGSPAYGVGPQDVALSIIGEVFANGYVKNKVMEFVGPGVANLSADFRIGIDVMTTETTCLSSIWETDESIREYYEIHGRTEEFRKLAPGAVAYYDGVIRVDLSEIKPMIAMPFHPSHTYTIAEVNENLDDVLADVEKRAAVSLDHAVPFSLRNKVHDGKFYVDQGIIAGCAGGGFENICAAADIMRDRNTGTGGFSLSVYPASTPIYMELIRNGCAAAILETGAILKTAFCGPCFGAGDTPANGAFSIRHSTRNFPNREGSKLQNGQISSVALMDARSIAATAAFGGRLTSAADLDIPIGKYKYHFDEKIYKNRIFDAVGKAEPETEIQFGPGIKDWPAMVPLTQHLLLKVVAMIHDPVTTTDELIPSGETSSYRSNPLGLAEYTLSRKCPDYVSLAKEVREAEEERRNRAKDGSEKRAIKLDEIRTKIIPMLNENQEFGGIDEHNTGIGSTIFAVKPGDGSAREQAASCQKVLGGWANISHDYATKRYRSNLINWGMIPFIFAKEELPFSKGDYIFIPNIREKVQKKFDSDSIAAYVITHEEVAEFKNGKKSNFTEFTLRLGELTDEERNIILKGCLINYNKKTEKDILICEDNQINQEVIANHFDRAGLRYTIAENGEIGVKHVKQRIASNNPFDLILMDIQMPVMDGFKAAEAILALGVNTPIIALSANVTPEDRARYSKAGMAGYLIKPFKQDELLACLEKNIPSINVIDLKLGLLNSANNEVLQKKLLLKYLKAGRDNYDQIKLAATDFDNETGHRLAHTEKNAALLIGAAKLSEILDELEREFAKGMIEYPEELMAAYNKELDMVLTYVEGYKDGK